MGIASESCWTDLPGLSLFFLRVTHTHTEGGLLALKHTLKIKKERMGWKREEEVANQMNIYIYNTFTYSGSYSTLLISNIILGEYNHTYTPDVNYCTSCNRNEAKTGKQTRTLVDEECSG